MSGKNNLQLVQNQPAPGSNGTGTKPSQHNVKLIAELELFKNNSKKSWNLISKELSLSAAVVSTWRNKAYLGDVEQINDTVSKYLELQRKRAISTKVELNYVQTYNNRRMLDVLETAQVDSIVAAVVGDTGTSKTTSIKEFVRTHNNVINISMNGTYRFPVEILRVIHRHPLVNGSGIGTLNTLCREIGEELKDKSALIIVDQCDYLNLRSIDIFRTFNDEWKIGICFVGLPPFKQTIKGNEAQVRQVADRINPVLELKPMQLDDCKRIIEANLPTAIDFAEELHRYSGGSIRILSSLVYNVKKSMKSGAKISDKLIEKYHQTLIVRNLFLES